MDVTPEHLVVALMRRLTDGLGGQAPEAVYLPEYDERVSYDELIGIAAVAVSMAMAAMLEAVEASRGGVGITLDEVLDRCSLRVLAGGGAPQ